jgi:hypothetical protein
VSIEPAAAVIDIFDQLIEKIKSNRPLKTDGKGLTAGFVYSMLPLGEMVDPRDFKNPWSPMGGSNFEEELRRAQDEAAPAAPAEGGEPPAGSPDGALRTRRAIEAAYRTANLVDRMIMITTDGSYVPYPSERKISFNYEMIVRGMQPMPTPPRPADLERQIEEARKVLFVEAEDGVLERTPAYQRYVRNAEEHAEAVANFKLQELRTLADPALRDAWPIIGRPFRREVDQAWDDWKTQGAEKIEKALAVIESIGVNIDDAMIAGARKKFDAYRVELAGVPDPVSYAYVSPSRWYDPDSDDTGWQKLSTSQGNYNSYSNQLRSSHFKSFFQQDSSSTGGQGGCFLGFGAFGASHARGRTEGSTGTEQSSFSQLNFQNTAKNITLDIEYGLCTIYRPWLVGDLFYLRNWYLVTNKKNAVSDGTIEGQAAGAGVDRLLPMIPRQFLVIRNVKIKSDQWGSDGQVMDQAFSQSAGSWNSSTTSTAGSGGLSLGFITIAGSGSRSTSHARTDNSVDTWGEHQERFGVTWKNGELSIKGAQIIGWLSEVVPACPPLDAPEG